MEGGEKGEEDRHAGIHMVSLSLGCIFRTFVYNLTLPKATGRVSVTVSIGQLSYESFVMVYS